MSNSVLEMVLDEKKLEIPELSNHYYRAVVFYCVARFRRAKKARNAENLRQDAQIGYF